MRQLKKSNLPKLVKSLEKIFHETPVSVLQNRPKLSPHDMQIKEIVSYLLTPHAHGYWSMTAPWSYSSKLQEYLLEKCKTIKLIEDNEPFSLDVMMSLTEGQRWRIVLSCGRIDTLFDIFVAAKIHKSKGSSETKFYKIYDVSIDLEEFVREFEDEFRRFEADTFFDGIADEMGRRIAFPEGIVYVIKWPTETGQLMLASVSQHALQRCSDFLCNIGAISQSKLQRTFSPEEDLFYPYFYMLNDVFEHVIEDSGVRTTFEQALKYYNEDDYKHCISTLGLIAEEYLSRIYTTLLRKESVPGKTLGHLIHSIQNEVRAIHKARSDEPQDLRPLYGQIKELEKSKDIQSLPLLLRNFLEVVKSDRTYYLRKLDSLKNDSKYTPPFPMKISESLLELLGNRNAASHNTRIPLGGFEADRTLYCLVSVIHWWQQVLATVDWNQSASEVINELTTKLKT